MKILFSSYAYAPSVGGIETTSALLTREFIAAGHEIVLVTETPGTQTANDSFPNMRKPTLSQLRKQLRWCDVVFENNITLRHLIPALVARKPVLLVHQTWMRNTAGEIGWNDRLKRALVSRVKNIAISEAIAGDIGAPAEIIGNPYDDNVFKLRPGIARDRDIIFVGRLVSDKGADLLLRALSLLKGPRTNLTIVGHGPEEKALRALASELKLDVTFAGAMSGTKLAELLNRHQIVAIPSRWPEPFGVVALEGIACGCIPVGSEQGGLREAIGPCGLTFANNDAQQLADRLQDLLADPLLREKLRATAPTHLEHFRASAVAQRYLGILPKLVA
jgi:glycogen(starch) synthase